MLPHLKSIWSIMGRRVTQKENKKGLKRRREWEAENTTNDGNNEMSQFCFGLPFCWLFYINNTYRRIAPGPRTFMCLHGFDDPTFTEAICCTIFETKRRRFAFGKLPFLFSSIHPQRPFSGVNIFFIQLKWINIFSCYKLCTYVCIKFPLKWYAGKGRAKYTAGTFGDCITGLKRIKSHVMSPTS